MAERLDSLWSEKEPDFEQVRNPFALPASWFGNAGHRRRSSRPMRWPFYPDPSARGRSSWTAEKSYALVDDQFLVPGQTLDGFTLVSVGDRSAVFEREGAQAVLELINKMITMHGSLMSQFHTYCYLSTALRLDDMLGIGMSRKRSISRRVHR